MGSSCKYRSSLAERCDCTETIINQLLADSYQNPISERQVKTSSEIPLILHYGELYNYFIIYYSVIIIEIKCTINVMCLNHPETIPCTPRSIEKCLPRNLSLVPKRLGTAVLYNHVALQLSDAKHVLRIQKLVKYGFCLSDAYNLLRQICKQIVTK